MCTNRNARWAREQLRFLGQNVRISHHRESTLIKRPFVLARRLVTSRNRSSIPVYWDRNPRTPNFGDELTPVMIEGLTDRQASWSPSSRTTLLGAGSILECLWNTDIQHAGEQTRVVAGSGFMFQDSRGWPPSTSVLSVRGYLTRKRLGKAASALPVGDPGLMMSMVFPQTDPAKESSDGILLIPHLVDAHDPAITQLRARWPNSEVANTSDDPVRLAARIASASIVISTALHPLVVADSYGTPNAWLKVSNRLLGGDFKFRDYASVFDFEPVPETPDSLEKMSDSFVNRVVENYTRPNLSEIQREVQRSFIGAIERLDEIRS